MNEMTRSGQNGLLFNHNPMSVGWRSSYRKESFARKHRKVMFLQSSVPWDSGDEVSGCKNNYVARNCLKCPDDHRSHILQLPLYGIELWVWVKLQKAVLVQIA